MAEKPPYTITPDILSRVERIGEMIGRAETLGVSRDLRLRRINRIRTIHGSLAIEGNILSEEEIRLRSSTASPLPRRRETLRKPAMPSGPTINSSGGIRPTRPTCCSLTRF